MSEPYPNPYGDLHIYYLEGRVEQGRSFGDSFIGNWEEDGHSFLFFTQPSIQLVEGLVDEDSGLNLIDQFQMTYDEWHGGAVVPFKTGRISVRPPWWQSPSSGTEEDAAHTGANPGIPPLLLDPGVVFGTGFHPTTRDCILALEKIGEMDTFGTVFDIGTGTGLLALAAVKLGGRRAIAVDLNLLAVQTTQRNIRLNKMEDHVLAVHGNAENFMDFPRDLMISNIHYDVMKRLVESSGFLLNQYFILSGLLRSQAGRIEKTLGNYPVEIIEKWGADGIWHTYLGCVR